MTATLATLPTRATSYCTVRKHSSGWAVMLVTPCPGKALRTPLYWHATREAAEDEARAAAARMQRPFKAGRAGA